jgi:hypothetical protein
MFEKPMKEEELMHILRKLKQKGLAECAFIDGQVQWRLTKAGLARGGDIDALAEEIMADSIRPSAEKWAQRPADPSRTAKCAASRSPLWLKFRLAVCGRTWRLVHWPSFCLGFWGGRDVVNRR